jgi:hypothetical protein
MRLWRDERKADAIVETVARPAGDVKIAPRAKVAAMRICRIIESNPMEFLQTPPAYRRDMGLSKR